MAVKSKLDEDRYRVNERYDKYRDGDEEVSVSWYMFKQLVFFITVLILSLVCIKFPFTSWCFIMIGGVFFVVTSVPSGF